MGIPSISIQHCHTKSCIRDGICYSGIVAREYLELHSLPCAVEGIVQGHSCNDEGGESKDYHLPGFVWTIFMLIDKVTRRDDDTVTQHDTLPEGDVLVLIDNGCYDICTSCTSIV